MYPLLMIIPKLVEENETDKQFTKYANYILSILMTISSVWTIFSIKFFEAIGNFLYTNIFTQITLIWLLIDIVVFLYCFLMLIYPTKEDIMILGQNESDSIDNNNNNNNNNIIGDGNIYDERIHNSSIVFNEKEAKYTKSLIEILENKYIRFYVSLHLSLFIIYLIRVPKISFGYDILIIKTICVNLLTILVIIFTAIYLSRNKISKCYSVDKLWAIRMLLYGFVIIILFLVIYVASSIDIRNNIVVIVTLGQFSFFMMMFMFMIISNKLIIIKRCYELIF